MSMPSISAWDPPSHTDPILHLTDFMVHNSHILSHLIAGFYRAHSAVIFLPAGITCQSKFKACFNYILNVTLSFYIIAFKLLYSQIIRDRRYLETSCRLLSCISKQKLQ